MYRISVLFVISVFALLFSCKNDPNSSTPEVQHADPNIMEGHWIAMDFCARANQYSSVLAAMNNGHVPYAYAISFSASQPDSVLCYNGFESWKLAVKYNVDTIEIREARPGKSIFMIYSPSAKELTMFDATNDRGAQLDRFIKSKAGSPNGYTAFSTALNHNIFEGVFTPVGKKVDKPVQFSPGGYILDFPDYDRYMLCTGGDCFLVGDQMDVVSFANTKDKNSLKMFGFRYSTKGDTLNIYNLIESQTEKSATVGKIAYQFLRKIAEPVSSSPKKQPAQAPNTAAPAPNK